jgi:hypothetical protein
MEVKGLEQPAKPLENSHIETHAAHKQAQLPALPNEEAHTDQRLTDIVNIWPCLTESERNRAHEIASDALSERGTR